MLAEKIAKSYPLSLLKTLNLLADIYQSKNNPDSSLKYLRMSIILKDSLFNREKTNAFQNVIFKDKEKQKEVEATKSKLQREYLTYFLMLLYETRGLSICKLFVTTLQMISTMILVLH